MLHIRLSNPDKAQSLCDFFTRVSGYARRTSEPRIILVELPGALSPTHERREVANYITTWKMLRRGCDTEIIATPR